MSGRRAWLLAALTALAVVVSSCTGVPVSSGPQVIRPVEINPQAPVNPPPNDADPTTIVEDFLAANAAHTANHTEARQYLTADYRSRWSDATMTVVSDAPVGVETNGAITISTQLVGTVDEQGQYTPALRGSGNGSGGTPQTVAFGITTVNGQYRIDSVSPNTLVLTSSEFAHLTQRALYFFDSSDAHLVPDPRYTQLLDPGDLAGWLVTQLAANPPPGLQTELPQVAEPARVRVTMPRDPSSGSPVLVEIPTASQLDGGTLNRLAAQIAATLEQVRTVFEIEVTDGGKPVRIPSVSGPMFTDATVANPYTVQPPSRGGLYYVHDGGVFDDTGARLPGKVGAGIYGLSSVALQQSGSSNTYAVAGVRISGKVGTLDIGTQNGLTATTVRGQLSRPAWAPSLPEVWIGVGSDLERVSTTGVVSVVPVDVATGKALGVVSAVRISPDGGRVALVLTASNGASQAYVGTIERAPAGVRVTGLTAITPQAVNVTDIAWNDQLKLFAIGTNTATNRFGVFEVQCDGSLWTPRSTSGLSGTPQSVTVAANSVAAVSGGGLVWRQDASSEFAGTWEGLTVGETPGQNPVYVE